MDRENHPFIVWTVKIKFIWLQQFSSQIKKKSKKIFHPVVKPTRLPVLLKVTPHTWVHARNSILSSAVNALANEKTQPFQKAVNVDQLYSLVQPSFTSPLMFASNLFAYSVTRSKLVLNMYGKFHTAGGITTAQTWLNNLTMDFPQVPGGDILVAIDNDQVLIKNGLSERITEHRLVF